MFAEDIWTQKIGYFLKTGFTEVNLTPAGEQSVKQLKGLTSGGGDQTRSWNKAEELMYISQLKIISKIESFEDLHRGQPQGQP